MLTAQKRSSSHPHPCLSSFLSFFLSFAIFLWSSVFFFFRWKRQIYCLDFGLQRERDSETATVGNREFTFGETEGKHFERPLFFVACFSIFFKFIFIYLLIFGIRILIYLLSLFFERWLDNSTTISRQNLSGKLYSNFSFFFIS